MVILSGNLDNDKILNPLEELVVIWVLRERKTNQAKDNNKSNTLGARGFLKRRAARRKEKKREEIKLAYSSRSPIH